MFLDEPPQSDDRDAAYASDLEENGFVWTLTKLWAWSPELEDTFGELLAVASEAAGLSFRDRGVVVSATAATIENSGCSLAWGNRLADTAGLETAIGVIRGTESPGMTERDRALSRWARKVASHPTSTTAEDVEELRAIGFDDRQIHAVTVYIAFRIAYAVINDSLDAPLDRAETEKYPEELVAAVDYGRPVPW